MPMFCKQCESRRYPIVQVEEKITIWLCKTCKNYVDSKDQIIREWTEDEKNKMQEEKEAFTKSLGSLPEEKLSRRKGVN